MVTIYGLANEHGLDHFVLNQSDIKKHVQAMEEDPDTGFIFRAEASEDVIAEVAKALEEGNRHRALLRTVMRSSSFQVRQNEAEIYDQVIEHLIDVMTQVN